MTARRMLAAHRPSGRRRPAAAATRAAPPAEPVAGDAADGLERLSSCLTVRRREDPGQVELTFAGELDLAADEAVRDAIDRALRGHPPRLVLDLRELTFMDSTGTRILLAIQARADAGRWGLVVRCGPVVERVLTLSGIGRRFDLRDVPCAEGRGV